MMRMTIYDVNKIKLGDTEETPYTHGRTLYIHSAERVIEIALFGDDADKLKALNLFEDKSL